MIVLLSNIDIVKSWMEFAAELSVPLIADISIRNNWAGEADTDER